MEHHQINIQLKRLLKRGYSMADAKKLLSNPQDTAENSGCDIVAGKRSRQRALRNQYHQARYAMSLPN